METYIQFNFYNHTRLYSGVGELNQRIRPLGLWEVVFNADTNKKRGVATEDTFPILSIVDPKLMLSLPKSLTAYQGFAISRNNG